MSFTSASTISWRVILRSCLKSSFSFSVRAMPCLRSGVRFLTSTRHEPHSPSWQSKGIGILLALATARIVPRCPAIAYTVTSLAMTGDENVMLAIGTLLYSGPGFAHRKTSNGGPHEAGHAKGEG